VIVGVVLGVGADADADVAGWTAARHELSQEGLVSRFLGQGARHGAQDVSFFGLGTRSGARRSRLGAYVSAPGGASERLVRDVR
jgi:hypothetical protein